MVGDVVGAGQSKGQRRPIEGKTIYSRCVHGEGFPVGKGVVLRKGVKIKGVQ